jgi:DNA (cytosine-5)-methyltransferase 1
MTINTKELPDFDLLIAWFPCQTFSVIWQRKWMEDPRWQIIFWIEKILKEKNIKYFILENVKWLVNHDWGKTMKSIVKLLDDAWYYVSWKVLNSMDYWLPQSRERVYLLWVKKDLKPFASKLEFPSPKNREDLSKYLIETSEEYYLSEYKKETMLRYLNNKYNKWIHTVNDIIKKEGYIIDTRQSDIRFYNWFSPTLRTWRHWLMYSQNWKLREISWLESLLLQWIPFDIAIKTIWKINNKDLLWQAGNAMSVHVIREIWNEFMNFILSNNPKYDRSRTKMINNSKTVIQKWIWRNTYIQQLETR